MALSTIRGFDDEDDHDDDDDWEAQDQGPDAAPKRGLTTRALSVE